MGYQYPPFRISNNYDNEAKEILGENVITKAIEQNIGEVQGDKIYIQRVQRLEKVNYKEPFFPSFLQREITKEYEVRLFYQDGVIYSIMFGSNSKKVDMRDNYFDPWYEPFELPSNVKLKITNFMKRLSLLSGSIDMIKSLYQNQYDTIIDDYFRFLEEREFIFCCSKMEKKNFIGISLIK